MVSLLLMLFYLIGIKTFCPSDYGPIEVPEAVQSVATYETNGPRLMITQIVNENFKSYAGVQTLGPFNRVGSDQNL